MTKRYLIIRLHSHLRNNHWRYYVLIFSHDYMRELLPRLLRQNVLVSHKGNKLPHTYMLLKSPFNVIYVFRVFKFHTVQDLNTLLIEDYCNHTFEDGWMSHIRDNITKYPYCEQSEQNVLFFCCIFNSLLFPMRIRFLMRMTEKTRCA